ncbi:MAG: hypothetical protein GC189_14065 [Alphaproteobacteria bacterium]|nr:hypothetical protein [Alphaproteobacteria bacterium]
MLQEHMKETYEFLFDEAHVALQQGGSLRPLGAGIRRTGERIQAQVETKPGDEGADAHIRGLIAGFQHEDKTNGLIAAGLVFDAAMTDGGTAYARALYFHLEAANGRAIEVVIPYESQLGVIDFAEPAVSEVAAEIFTNATQS